MEMVMVTEMENVQHQRVEASMPRAAQIVLVQRLGSTAALHSGRHIHAIVLLLEVEMEMVRW